LIPFYQFRKPFSIDVEKQFYGWIPHVFNASANRRTATICAASRIPAVVVRAVGLSHDRLP
jgi:hypothetical protein